MTDKGALVFLICGLGLIAVAFTSLYFRNACSRYRPCIRWESEVEIYVGVDGSPEADVFHFCVEYGPARARDPQACKDWRGE